MKNQHIENLLIPVPKETRLQVYKELIAKIEELDPLPSLGTVYALCIALPIVLWDLPSMCTKAPDNRSWSLDETLIAFPEFHPKDIELIELSTDHNATRLILLNSWVKYLEP